MVPSKTLIIHASKKPFESKPLDDEAKVNPNFEDNFIKFGRKRERQM